MFAMGVTCSNCHDPHSLQLRAPGNQVCAQCHLPAKFDTEAHSITTGVGGRSMRQLPHADPHLHGDRRPARSRHPCSTARTCPSPSARPTPATIAIPTAPLNGRRIRWRPGTAQPGDPKPITARSSTPGGRAKSERMPLWRRLFSIPAAGHRPRNRACRCCRNSRPTRAGSEEGLSGGAARSPTRSSAWRLGGGVAFPAGAARLRGGAAARATR